MDTRMYSPSPSVKASPIPLYQLGWLGQDDNLPGDLTSSDMQEVTAAYNSGALSSAGYNQILSGNVSSANLSDFLAADPGAAQAPSATTPSAALISPSTESAVISKLISAGTTAAAQAITGAPAIGQTEVVNGVEYVWNGTAWAPVGGQNWLTASSLISGIPNWTVIVGVIVGWKLLESKR